MATSRQFRGRLRALFMAADRLAHLSERQREVEHQTRTVESGGVGSHRIIDTTDLSVDETYQICLESLITAQTLGFVRHAFAPDLPSQDQRAPDAPVWTLADEVLCIRLRRRQAKLACETSHRPAPNHWRIDLIESSGRILTDD